MMMKITSPPQEPINAVIDALDKSNKMTKDNALEQAKQALIYLRGYARSTDDNIPVLYFERIDHLTETISQALEAKGDEIKALSKEIDEKYGNDWQSVNHAYYLAKILATVEESTDFTDREESTKNKEISPNGNKQDTTMPDEVFITKVEGRKYWSHKPVWNNELDKKYVRADKQGAVDVEGLKDLIANNWGGNGIDKPCIDDLFWVVDFLNEQNHLKGSTPEPQWQTIDSAPKDETTFICRDKDKPWVTFEAVIFQDSESYEMPEEYDVLHNMTMDEPIPDNWDYFEWMPLPKPPQENTDDT